MFRRENVRWSTWFRCEACPYGTGLLLAQGASAQSCEPAKVAQKYPSLAGKTIKIGVDPESPPYAFRDSKDFNKIIGADADMARAVFACAGVKTEFFTAGWPGLLPALRAGQIDVMWDLLYYTPERAKETSFVTYMQAGTGGLVAAGNPKKIDDIAKLCGTTVTAGIGTVELTMAQTRVPAGYPQLHSTDTRALGAIIDYFKYAAPK